MERVHEGEDGGGGDDDVGFSEKFSYIMLEIYQVELLRESNKKKMEVMVMMMRDS
ncbi:unnamed protein product [Dovyalis caffra]|uniref:Uncharacterized protein n=1 Tax=Dovyalis caffra TaxID=77055 RepID=A0AAV1SNK5_9ROSI|nr:unnamed protein product [Dovyalis caffra]